VATVNLPIWLVIILLGAGFSIIGYLYRRNHIRIEKLENWREACMSKGQLLTLLDHAGICKIERESVAKLIQKSFADFEKLMDLKFQNLELVIKQNGHKKEEQ
jgi:hypothetical protein